MERDAWLDERLRPAAATARTVACPRLTEPVTRRCRWDAVAEWAERNRMVLVLFLVQALIAAVLTWYAVRP